MATQQQDLVFTPAAELTINSIFGSQPGVMAKQVARILNSKMCGSLAPVLLTSRASLRQIDGIGRGRAQFIQESLENVRHRLRLEEERVHERAKSLFGSVRNTPAQALLITSEISGAITAQFFVPSPAVALVVELTPGISIGELSDYAANARSLANYFELCNCSIDKNRVNDKYAELVSRLSSWRLSLE